MPTWLLFLILLVVILIIVWILLSGNPVIEEEEEDTALETAVEEPVAAAMETEMVEESVSEPPPVVVEETETELSDDKVSAIDENIKPDDLKKIEGIGPKISGLLLEKGIKTFAQLADKNTEDIQAILDEAKIRIANPATWTEQAKFAADGAWDSLEKLQDELKGGRREPK